MTTFWSLFAGFNVLLFTSVLVVVAIRNRRGGGGNASALTPAEQRQRWAARAPGWQIRCLKCDFTEPFGKYGIRMRAAGKKYTWGYCSHCHGLRFYAIEREKSA